MLRAALAEILERAWSPTAKGIARKALKEGRQLRLDVNRRERVAPQIPKLPQDIFYMENERHRQSRP